jgi:putative ubiquitin-RnfH superfamily antitoxin RatB of RatAB toxin-antitoxin module
MATAEARPDPGAAAPATTIEVEVAFSAQARDVALVRLALPAGSRVVDALRACPWPVLQRLPEAAPGTEAATWAVGIWGRPQPLDHPLRERDRVEVWRPLAVDPKDARRERFDRAGGVRELRKRQRALKATKAAKAAKATGG